jgi:hypothetical protein
MGIALEEDDWDTTLSTDKVSSMLDSYSPSPPPVFLVVLRVFARFLRPSQPYTISLAPHSRAFLRLPAALFSLLSRRLCNSMLLIRAAHWALSGMDARPRLNSTTPLLSNMTTLEVGTICNKTSVMVRRSKITLKGPGLTLTQSLYPFHSLVFPSIPYLYSPHPEESSAQSDEGACLSVRQLYTQYIFIYLYLYLYLYKQYIYIYNIYRYVVPVA